MAVLPLLVTRRVAVKPVFHSLLTMYWHLPPPTALLLDELELLVFTELLVDVAELVDVATDDELLVFTLDDVDVATEVATELDVLVTAELVLLEVAVPTIP